jgi:hypothetical protein
MGDRAFFVTFRQVDPLFALDLSNPTNPELLGELKIPGYSDYLQPIDENHLLAIGRGANETTGLFEELQVSIFDVSDMTAPELVHRYSFAGGRATATPATGDRWVRGDGDHHAVGYFPSAQIFTLPIYSPGEVGWWGGENTSAFGPFEGGLQVFRIDVSAGFTPVALIEHEALVHRSLQIGDRLFAISDGAITVHDMNDPSQQLGQLDLASSAPAAPVTLRMFAPALELAHVFEKSLTIESASDTSSIERDFWSNWRPEGRRSLAQYSAKSTMAPRTHGIPSADFDFASLLAPETEYGLPSYSQATCIVAPEGLEDAPIDPPNSLESHDAALENIARDSLNPFATIPSLAAR